METMQTTRVPMKTQITEEWMEEQCDFRIKEMAEMINGCDNDGFPDFLFDIKFAVDEKDPYYEIATGEFQIPDEVLHLRRKYDDFYEWDRAMDIFKEYMERLYNFYGGKSIFKSSYNVGMVDEYVPQKPKLKMTRENRSIIESGVPPTMKFEVGPWDAVELMKKIPPVISNEEIDRQIRNGTYFDFKPPKKLKKLFNRAARKMQGNHREDTLYRGDTRIGCDLMLAILESFRNGFYNNAIDDDDDDEDELYNAIIESQMSPYRDPDVEYWKKHRFDQVQVNGQTLTLEQATELEVIEDFAKLGINLVSGRKKNDIVVKLAKRTLSGAFDEEGRPMTKKQLKKWRKQKEKEKKFLIERSKQDPIIKETLLKGYEKPFTDPQSMSMIDFTLGSVFK